jgi:hypothetical protein
MNTAWSHLPNATAIDRIIADVKTNGPAWDEAWDEAWHAASDAAWDAARSAARHAAMDAAGGAAWGSILALIAWDDCGHLLDNDPKHVHLLALLGQPATVLLLPAAIALNKGDR